MGKVLGEDELGLIATSLFQSALTVGTCGHYSSNLTSFLKFCPLASLDPLEVTPVDIARYIAWLGQRGSVADKSLQPYLSAINKFLKDHALPPVVLGPLVVGVSERVS